MTRPILLDTDSFCENLPEITSMKILNKKKFCEQGLFSEQIFGPVKNYTCQCGIYHGIRSDGGFCKTCNIDIVNSSERRRRYAKIVLPIPVVNPIFYDLVINIGGSRIREILIRLMKDETSILIWDEEEEFYKIIDVSERSPNIKTWDRNEAIHEVVYGLAKKYTKEGISKWDVILNNIDKLFINNIIVLPPDLRPASNSGGKNKKDEVDKLNRFYVQILTKKEIMSSTIVDILRDKILYYNYFRQIQKDINELYVFILEKLSKKEGLIRGNILGKRIDFSGRAVIIPEPTLNLDECCLPYLMLLELFKLQISKKLVELNKFKLLNEAIDFVDEAIKFNSMVLYKICKEIIKGEVCILNRQPSLHRLGMLGFYIKITTDTVIKIHPLICPPFNADFDGDQMAVYVPIGEEAKQEIINKILVTKNFTNPANGKLTTTPSQDIILGIYALTNNKFPKFNNKILFKGKSITEGIKIFNECLPENYPLIDKQLNEGDLINILDDIKKIFPPNIVAITLDKIKKIGFKYATLFGATMSLRNCRVNNAEEIRKSIYEGDDIMTQIQRISSDETTTLLRKSFNYSYMIESGARGSWDQARQLILTRGFISNFKGEILSTPIKHNLIDGLSQEEFFLSTNGCRKGLLDVALNTGTSGYLSRKLIYACSNLKLGNKSDCGTNDFLTVYVSDLKKAKMLLYRFIKDNDSLIRITEKNHKDFIGKTIKLRSPIFCKNKDICYVCYGDMHKHINSRFIGVIAAQSLGECNTQLVLRTFHISGSASIRKDKSNNEEDDMKQQDIVNDLSKASSLLHQFNSTTNPDDLCKSLYDVYNTSRTIQHIHFECIVSQLMWSDYNKWRLLENRDMVSPEYHSVQTVPTYESWLLALAFSNPKRSIIKGLVNSGLYTGIIDKILKGEVTN